MVAVPTLTNVCGIEGALSSSGGDQSTGGPTGKGRGGEGFCETGTWVEFGIGVGKAAQCVTTEAAIMERVESFILMKLDGLEVECWILNSDIEVGC